MASTKQQIESPVTTEEIENTVVHEDASPGAAARELAGAVAG